MRSPRCVLMARLGHFAVVGCGRARVVEDMVPFYELVAAETGIVLDDATLSAMNEGIVRPPTTRARCLVWAYGARN